MPFRGSCQSFRLTLSRRSSSRWRNTAPVFWKVNPPTRCFQTRPDLESNPSSTPARKVLKDEAKRRRLAARDETTVVSNLDPIDERAWELTVGIEIHAELDVERKLFSSAITSANDPVNENIALFDLAYPGSQPSFRVATLLPALRAALTLNCRIQPRSSFDRKHYFYQDQPSGYQITQYYEPFAKDGSITLYEHDGIAPEDGESITIGIKQVQMEQDTGKTLHQPGEYGFFIDFNRVSHPLIEIITLPQIHHPATAAACVRKVQALLRAVGAVTAGMEVGGLRADVNVSVRRKTDQQAATASTHSYHGISGLGQRTEIKNLSSIKAVEDAIIAERNRQIRLLAQGQTIQGETRAWSLGSTETTRLRGKEGEIDYRYMPDPDLGPVLISEELVQHVQQSMPPLPDTNLDMLISSKYGLTKKDARTLLLLDNGHRLDYYLDVVHILRTLMPPKGHDELGKSAGNWVIHELGGLCSRHQVQWSPEKVASQKMAEIITSVLSGNITTRSAKHILSLTFRGDQRSIDDIKIQENMIIQEVPEENYRFIATRLVEEHPEVVRAIKEKDQKGKIGWLVGQMLQQLSKEESGHGVRPETAKSFILEALSLPSDDGKKGK